MEDLVRRRTEELAKLQTELSTSRTSVGGAEKELVALRAKAAELETAARGREAEAGRLRETVASTEKNLATAEALLQAKKEELDRVLAQQASGPPASDKLLAAISERLEQISKPTEVSQIMLSLDGLSRRLSNLSAGGGHLGAA